MLNAAIRELIHIPGHRGEQQRKWLLARVPGTSPFAANEFEGPFEKYVPSLIEQWQDSRDQPKLSKLNDGMAFLDLAFAVRTVRLNESEIEILVPRTRSSGDNDLVNIADVGLAVTAAISVMTALIQADPGQLVYIEQPELHLHPRAQWRLAQLLVQAANRGVRLVIETHSSLLLQGIMTQVAKGGISRENVALHWFARDEEGITKVTTADVDAEGRFGDWPADFDDVELKATNAYLDAVETKLMERKGAA
jgi:predicted ATPase